MRQFLLPDLGEGLEEAEIVAWHVDRGRSCGRRPAARVGRDGQGRRGGALAAQRPRRTAVRRQGRSGEGRSAARRVCRGAGSRYRHGRRRAGSGRRKARRHRATPGEPVRAGSLQVLPAVRALARKLDVDLNLVHASGPDGTITRADVERAAKSLTEAGPAEALRGMRRAMAQRMTAAHAEVVPASVMEEADIGDWTIRPRRHHSPRACDRHRLQGRAVAQRLVQRRGGRAQAGQADRHWHCGRYRGWSHRSRAAQRRRA